MQATATATESSITSLMRGGADKERGKIFNSVPDKKVAEPAKVEPKKETKEDNDDDWGAIPAFLRRSRLK